MYKKSNIKEQNLKISFPFMLNHKTRKEHFSMDKSPCNSMWTFNNASPQGTFHETITLLPLRKEDIGDFVGEDGSLFREHVVKHASDVLLKKSGYDDPDPHVTIKVVTLSNGLDVVVAECFACSEELLAEVKNSLAQYQKNFMKTRGML